MMVARRLPMPQPAEFGWDGIERVPDIIGPAGAWTVGPGRLGLQFSVH